MPDRAPAPTSRACRAKTEVDFLKAEIPVRIEAGRSLAHVIAALHVSWAELTLWRQEDLMFDAALQPASRTHVAPLSAKHERYTPEEIAFFKAELPERIAVGRKPLTKAMTDLGLSWSAVARWRQEDTAFDELLRVAVEFLTEAEADRLKELHTEITDPKVAKVASDNLKTWLGWRNTRFAPKKPDDDGPQAQLTDILRAAVNRLIEMTPAVPVASAPAPPMIDLQPSQDSPSDNGQ